MANESRQIVFRYNGDPHSEETEQDLDGDFPLPNAGDLMERNGKKWKVIKVDETRGSKTEWPVYRIYLQETP